MPLHRSAPDRTDATEAGTADGAEQPTEVDQASTVPDADADADASRPGRRRVRWWVLGVVLVLVVLVGWLAFRGYQAGTALLEAEATVGSVEAAIRAGDVEAAAAVLPELTKATDTAVAATGDPLWRAAGVVPWLGPQLGAVGEVSRALDVLVDDVLAPLAAMGGGLDLEALVPVDGAFDVATMESVGPVVAAAAHSAARAEQMVTGIDTDPLVAPLAERLVGLQGTVADVASTLTVAGEVLTVLPPMLGADGPRTYLVLFLNNAELRTGGGIVGAAGVIAAEAGRVELIDYRAAAGVDKWAEPVLRLDPGEEGVHTALMGRMLQNVSMSPHFPRTAELATEMWRRSGGQPVDAVLAVDPVALSYVLDATGPVTVADAELGGDAVVSALLSEAYWRFPDPAASDEFFATAATSVFGALTDGGAAPRALLDGLVRAADEHRVRMWSSHPAEQELLASTPLAGAFFSPEHGAAAGVFLDDGTAGKMDYYLATRLSVEDMTCTAEGAATATVRLDLRSDVPADPSSIPAYVTGDPGTGVTPGSIRTNVTVYAPVGGSLGTLRLDAAAIGGRQGNESGRDVAVLGSVLAPGEAQTFRFEIGLPAGAPELVTWTTPALGSTGPVAAEACTA